MWLIKSGSTLNLLWEQVVLITILVVTIFFPLNMAFVTEESTLLTSVYVLVDFVFLLDIIMNFFTTYIDSVSNLEVLDHKRIALSYIKSWFVFDVFSIIPFDYLFLMIKNDDESQSDILKFTKFARIYRLMRLTRIFKVVKLFKSRKTFISQFAEKLRITKAIERLIVFGIYWLLLTHVSACLWIIMGDLFEGEDVNWIQEEGALHGVDLYILSFYFIVTTAATVGYGDISATNTAERIFCSILMVLSVSSFSFVAGQLSSIVTNHDQKEAELSEKILKLNRLQDHYELHFGLVAEIKQTLRYDSTAKNISELDDILDSLPIGLRK